MKKMIWKKVWEYGNLQEQIHAVHEQQADNKYIYKNLIKLKQKSRQEK